MSFVIALPPIIMSPDTISKLLWQLIDSKLTLPTPTISWNAVVLNPKMASILSQ